MSKPTVAVPAGGKKVSAKPLAPTGRAALRQQAQTANSVAALRAVVLALLNEGAD